MFNEKIEDYHKENDIIGENKQYQIRSCLGNGNYGQVYLAEKNFIKKSLSELVAIKVIKYSSLKQMQQIINEAKLQKSYKHPNICQILDQFTHGDKGYLVQQYCELGDLYTYICKTHIRRRVDEQTAIHYMKQIIAGFRYIHSCKFLEKQGQILIYRDLKLENILVKNINSQVQLLISDFGMAKFINKDQNQLATHTIAGSPLTMAPEVFLQKYDEKVDIYSLGVIFYQFLYGQYPIIVHLNIKNDLTQEERQQAFEKLLQKIKSYVVSYEGENISEKTQQLLKQMMCINVEERITFQQLFDHPYFFEDNQILINNNNNNDQQNYKTLNIQIFSLSYDFSQEIIQRLNCFKHNNSNQQQNKNLLKSQYRNPLDKQLYQLEFLIVVDQNNRKSYSEQTNVIPKIVQREQNLIFLLLNLEKDQEDYTDFINKRKEQLQDIQYKQVQIITIVFRRENTQRAQQQVIISDIQQIIKQLSENNKIYFQNLILIDFKDIEIQLNAEFDKILLNSIINPDTGSIRIVNYNNENPKKDGNCC